MFVHTNAPIDASGVDPAQLQRVALSVASLKADLPRQIKAGVGSIQTELVVLPHQKCDILHSLANGIANSGHIHHVPEEGHMPVHSRVVLLLALVLPATTHAADFCTPGTLDGTWAITIERERLGLDGGSPIVTCQLPLSNNKDTETLQCGPIIVDETTKIIQEKWFISRARFEVLKRDSAMRCPVALTELIVKLDGPGPAEIPFSMIGGVGFLTENPSANPPVYSMKVTSIVIVGLGRLAPYHMTLAR